MFYIKYFKFILWIRNYKGFHPSQSSYFKYTLYKWKTILCIYVYVATFHRVHYVSTLTKASIHFVLYIMWSVFFPPRVSINQILLLPFGGRRNVYFIST